MERLLTSPAGQSGSTAGPSPNRPAEGGAAGDRLFTDVSAGIAHTHQDARFDDFERQPLLPFKFSQAGPGVAWLDLNGDGHEDLVIGMGRGGQPGVFLGDGGGKFQPVPEREGVSGPDDTAGLVAWAGGEGKGVVLGAVAGYEVAQAAGLQSWQLVGPKLVLARQSLPMVSSGALALGDPAGDGRLVLFVAGGVLPGQYPLGAPSMLFRYQGGQWVPDRRNNVLLENLGIVNGAVWSDLDGDGFSELMLACEWGPVRVFRIRDGALAELTEAWGLAAHTGWWRGVSAGDFNGDGRMDLIVSNWGYNSPYRASPAQPLTFLHGQLFQPGVMEVIETEYVGGALQPRRQFMALANAMPFLFERFHSHQEYSEATVEQVLGDRLPLSRRVTVTTLASTLFLNTGTGFRVVELPREAQFAPAFSANVADFDGDGFEDVFLSQNFFATQPELPRMDAGSGLLLRGDGTGKLTAVPRAEAGLDVLGEQRGAAVADFDEDGRADLVVTQNAAATRLFRNTGAKPGLRVTLVGAPGNPAALGAVLRLHFASGPGPARELHAGSGYWSQDSLTQVLGLPARPEALWIRWPGGRATTTALPAGVREVVVDYTGRLIRHR